MGCRSWVSAEVPAEVEEGLISVSEAEVDMARMSGSIHGLELRTRAISS